MECHISTFSLKSSKGTYLYRFYICMSQETRKYVPLILKGVLIVTSQEPYLSRRAVILFIFKQLVCIFPTTGTPSHTRTVTTRSTSDAVKHFIKTAVYSGPVSSTCPAVRSATDIPCYCCIEPPHFPFASLAFSGFSVVPTGPLTGSFREHQTH